MKDKNEQYKGAKAVKADGTPLFEAESMSYWAIVWSQLRKSRLAILGLWSIALVVVIAVFAPLISLNRPFWFLLPEGVEREGAAQAFPFFSALFDANLFENGVDFYFNTWMVISPLVVMAWFVTKTLAKKRWRSIRLGFLAVLLVLQFALFLWLWLGAERRPYYDYRGAIDRYAEQQVAVSCRFPLFPYSFREVNVQNSLKSPSGAHIFGTDREGRDVFVRMVYGTRISLTIGVVAVSIYVFIGTFLGALAGFFRGWVDIVISRFIEIMLCFPAFFLILTLAAFIEHRSIFHIMLIIGVTRWTGVARLVRSEFLRQRNLDYVHGAVALGLGQGRIIFRHVLPNAIAPVLVAATFGVAQAIIIESALSFLGLGDVSAPSWGGILSAGREEFKMWLILIPGVAIFFLVSVFNLVGEGLRDAMDPKLRQ